MLEEITMEKKLSRSLQSPKGSADTKKNQDVAVGKSFPKSSRKREKPGQKVEQFKKPSNSSPNIKQHGRRTTTRTSHHAIGGKVTELAELDDEFDLKRSKKQNLTHLLNFHCKPRESALTTPYRPAPRGIFPYNSIRNLMTTQKHKYNKEQFLQANFQFVVRDDADYSVYLADPDILVDWNLIEQIRVSCFESVSCPICLESPIAGKITRCGHIYCWPCILHYLALTDKSWHKCPICFEAVHKKDLKSVRLVHQQWYNTGEEITFLLMKREHGSTVAIPVLETVSRNRNVLLSVAEDSRSTAYSKLLLVDQENVRKIIEVEENDLNKELKANEGCPEICFVEQAMELLNERKLKLFEKTDKNSANSCDCSSVADKSTVNNNPEVLAEISTTQEVTDSDSSFMFEADCTNSKTSCENECSESQSAECNPTSRTRYESVSSGGEDICTTVTAEDLEINANPNATSKYYFFYQGMDGQQIFLHSINARMLERQYGSLELSPPVLVGRIVEIESGSMTEELRKRLRYLQHLPITCQFQVVEIDLADSIVSEETKTFFKDQLEKRNRLRQKRARDEKKMEKRAESLVRKQYGCHSPPRRLRLDSLHHFPECGADEPCSISPRTKSPISSRTSSPSSSVSRRSISPVTSALNALSINNNTFAQKLKDTNKDGGWQKRARAVVSESGASCSHSCNLISDVVEMALIKNQLEKESNEQNFGKNKKKKKKQKPTPLCSVGMVYTNR